jgi:peptidoglycan/xylan/chitin deacetylase (PgdA/CDA1 family)
MPDWLALRKKISTTWEKNGAELQALLTRSVPPFLTARQIPAAQEEIPVFVYHSVQPERFEAQLRFLVENGYQTLSAESLLQAAASGDRVPGCTVALTFDDATASAWTVAHPLLKKYNLQAILFAIPGLIPDEGGLSPTLEEVWQGRAGLQAVLARERTPGQQLCTWAELQAMQTAGTFDIQAHSLTHSRVPVSPRVVDFLHPGYDTYFYHNVNIPVTSAEDPGSPVRDLRLGQPVYASASRLSGRLRFLENSRLSDAMVAYVAGQGGERVFEHKNWRAGLLQEHRRLLRQEGSAGKYETPDGWEAALTREMVESREILQQRLGKRVEHLCYPWYQGSPLSDRIAAASGYRAVYYGLEGRKSGPDPGSGMVRFRRVGEEYLQCLPGKGSVPLSRAWSQKIAQSFKKER